MSKATKKKQKNDNGAPAAPPQEMPTSFMIKDDDDIHISGAMFVGLTTDIKALPYSAIQETAQGQAVLGRLQRIAMDHYNKTQEGDK